MIRRLKEKDAPYMLEWMHDPEIAKCFKVNFMEHTIEDARRFISESFNEEQRHFAVVDENDMYMGTVSLKHISHSDSNAEFAAVMRKCAQGTGAVISATRETLDYAFGELSLHRVYTNVLEDNKRSCRYVEKCGFVYEGTFKDHLYINGEYHNLNWYAIINK